MVKWEVYHNLVKVMGVELSTYIMENIDDLIDAPPKGMRDLRNSFSQYISKFSDVFPIPPKPVGIKKAGRTKTTMFRMQLRFITEYYGMEWENCKVDKQCKEIITYYLFHHIASYFFNTIIPEGPPTTEKGFISRMNKKFLLDVWNSIQKDPEFNWLLPIYNNIVKFLYSKLRLVDSLPLFCDNGHGSLENLTIEGKTSIRICPVCGNIYVKNKKSGDE